MKPCFFKKNSQSLKIAKAPLLVITSAYALLSARKLFHNALSKDSISSACQETSREQRPLVERPTLPETNVAPQNRRGLKRKLVFQPSIFRCYVRFREGIIDVIVSRRESSSKKPRFKRIREKFPSE